VDCANEKSKNYALECTLFRTLGTLLFFIFCNRQQVFSKFQPLDSLHYFSLAYLQFLAHVAWHFWHIDHKNGVTGSFGCVSEKKINRISYGYISVYIEVLNRCLRLRGCVARSQLNDPFAAKFRKAKAETTNNNSHTAVAYYTGLQNNILKILQEG